MLLAGSGSSRHLVHVHAHAHGLGHRERLGLVRITLLLALYLFRASPHAQATSHALLSFTPFYVVLLLLSLLLCTVFLDLTCIDICMYMNACTCTEFCSSFLRVPVARSSPLESISEGIFD